MAKKPEVPCDKKTHEVVEPQLCPLDIGRLPEASLDSDIMTTYRRRNIEEDDRGQPKHYMRRPCLAAHADPRQADDEKDLGQHEIGQAEFLFE
jgi:hypothetical protein